MLSERARAKVNLTLHVTGRRADGFHALESVVAFAGVADHLDLEPGDLALEIAGPFGAVAGGGEDNLVLRAARTLAERVPGLRLGRFRLEKRLPVAAGLGGGSADAGAALRLLARANGLAGDDARLRLAAAVVGSDVPVCLDGRARMMLGRGDELGPPLRLPPLWAVLVNPGAAVSTAAVFAALALEPGEARPGEAHPEVGTAAIGQGALIELLHRARNDLEPVAAKTVPVIGEALDLLRAHGSTRLARMSGSGATVFALVADRTAAAELARAVRRARPAWWVRATVLR